MRISACTRYFPVLALTAALAACNGGIDTDANGSGAGGGASSGGASASGSSSGTSGASSGAISGGSSSGSTSSSGSSSGTTSSSSGTTSSSSGTTSSSSGTTSSSSGTTSSSSGTTSSSSGTTSSSSGTTSSSSGTTSSSSSGTTSSSSGSSSGSLYPNSGTTPTNVTKGGTALTGNFTCTQGSLAYGNVTTAVGTGGLVGGQLTTLLNTLGATTVTQLLNSITSPNNAIDDNLSTYASVSLTVGLLGGLTDSIDLSAIMPSGTTVPAGQYAVWALSFPAGTANLAAINSIEVATYLNNTLQESNTLSNSALTSLITGSTTSYLFVGVQTTKPYDRATIMLTPGVLTANVGDALNINELCVGGTM